MRVENGLLISPGCGCCQRELEFNAEKKIWTDGRSEEFTVQEVLEIVDEMEKQVYEVRKLVRGKQ